MTWADKQRLFELHQAYNKHAYNKWAHIGKGNARLMACSCGLLCWVVDGRYAGPPDDGWAEINDSTSRYYGDWPEVARAAMAVPLKLLREG